MDSKLEKIIKKLNIDDMYLEEFKSASLCGFSVDEL